MTIAAVLLAAAAMGAPVDRPCVTSPFGPRVIAHVPEAGTYHHGVDLRAPAGGTVRAVADGRIIRIDRRGAGGLELLVRHDGFDALYAHLGRLVPSLMDGRRTVRAGEMLGVVGRSGLTLGTHLYFEIWLDGARVDPAPLMGVASCSAR